MLHLHSTLRRTRVASTALLAALLLGVLAPFVAANQDEPVAGPPKPSVPQEKGPTLPPEELDAAVEALRVRVAEAREVAHGGDGMFAGRMIITVMDELTALRPPVGHTGADEVAHLAGRAASHAREYSATVRAWTWLLPRWRETRPADDAEFDMFLMTFARDALQNRDQHLARRVLEDLVEVRSTYLPEDDASMLAAIRDLSGVLFELRANEEALELLEPYHELQSALLAEDHQELLAARERLASLRFRMGDYTGAALLFRQMLDVLEANRAPGEDSIHVTRSNLLHVLYAMEDLETAVVEEEQAVLFFEVSSGLESVRLLGARRALAGSLFGLGDLPRARRLLERVAIDQARDFPAGDLDLAETRLNMAETLRRLGQPSEALTFDEVALASFDSDIKKDPTQAEWLKRVALKSLAVTSLALDRHAEAREALTTALDAGVVDMREELELRGLLADTLRAEGRLQEERALRQETLAGAGASEGVRSAVLLGPQVALAECLLRMGEAEEAMRFAELAIAEFASLGDAVAPELREAQAVLARAARQADDAARLQVALEGLARSAAAVLERAADPALPVHRSEDAAHLVVADLAALVELAPAAPSPGPLLERAFELLETRRAVLRHGPATPKIDVAALRERLSGAAVLSYHVLPPVAGVGEPARLVGLRLDASGVRAVELGALAEIESEVASWRAAAGSEASSPALDAATDALRARLVGPLDSPASSVTWLVPDDVLHGIPLAEIVGQGARTVASFAAPSAPIEAKRQVALVGVQDAAGPTALAATAFAALAEVEPHVVTAQAFNRVTLGRALRGARYLQIELPVRAEDAALSANSRARLAHAAGLGLVRPERPLGLATRDLVSLGLCLGLI